MKHDTKQAVTEQMYLDKTGMTRDEYWQLASSNRMDEFWEIVRLETVLKGFYYDEIQFGHNDYENIVDFCENAKRPFGNKSIDQSIAFNLGWDNKRMLCVDLMGLPKVLVDEAAKLRERLIQHLKVGRE